MALKSIQARLNSFTFYELIKNPKQSLDWCIKKGLISENYECPTCGKSMRIVSNGEGWMWVCKKTSGENPHHTRRSVRKGTWFEKSKINLGQILLITWYWVNQTPARCVKNEMGVSSQTMANWYSMCREVCLKACLCSSVMIGGPNRTIDVYESILSDKTVGEEVKWVIIGMDKLTEKFCFQVMSQRDKRALLDMIQTCIHPGSTVVSDCWLLYDCLEDKDFVRIAIERDITFKEPGSKHTIDNLPALSKRLRGKSRTLGHFDGYIAEYIWRRQHIEEIEHLLLSFIADIKKVFPPQKAVKSSD